MVFVRNPKARRYILRLQHGVARVTIPRGGTLQYGEIFLRKNAAWIEKQIRKTPPQWSDGTTILWRGRPVVLRVLESTEVMRVAFADFEFVLQAGADLRLGIEARLRSMATEELLQRTVELAREHSMEVRSISVRSQRSRWGSCSVRKTICLNWRLIQTPESVRDYIIHELMHLREMNHSDRFWEHVEKACPAYQDAERWLRRNSSLLR